MEDNTRTSPCSQKAAYANESVAIGASVVASSNFGTELITYHCQHCQLWHLATGY